MSGELRSMKPILVVVNTHKVSRHVRTHLALALHDAGFHSILVETVGTDKALELFDLTHLPEGDLKEVQRICASPF